MSNETVALILSIVGSAVGATWLIRSKLSELESALTAHIARSTEKQEALEGRVLRLEKKRSSR